MQDKTGQQIKTKDTCKKDILTRVKEVLRR